MNLLDTSDVRSVDLIGITSSLGLTQLVTEPTRVSSTSATLIDHLYTSSRSLVHSVRVGTPLGSSDHCSLHTILTLAAPRHKQLRRNMWLYKWANFTGMNEFLEDTLKGLCDATLAVWEKFRSSVCAAMKQFIPHKAVNCRRDLPWLTTKVKRLMRSRDGACQSAKRVNSAEAWSSFRSLRNKAVAALRKAKSEFYSNLSKQLKTLKDFWSSYRSITREYHRVPHEMSNGSHTATSTLGKATLLNDQFASHFTPAASVHPSLPPPHRSRPTLSSLCCTSGDVLGVLRSMRPKVASGPDGISSPVLRACPAPPWQGCSTSPCPQAGFLMSGSYRTLHQYTSPVIMV